MCPFLKEECVKESCELWIKNTVVTYWNSAGEQAGKTPAMCVHCGQQDSVH